MRHAPPAGVHDAEIFLRVGVPRLSVHALPLHGPDIVARHVGLSPRQLERLALRHSGHSPLRLYFKLRVEWAYELLLYSDRQLIEIGGSAGFDSTLQFAAWHRRIYGAASSVRGRRRNGLVLDLFAGSGSTLIGAHKTGRRARLVELDPIYCDRLIRRWEIFAKDEAELIACGLSASVAPAAESVAPGADLLLAAA